MFFDAPASAIRRWVGVCLTSVSVLAVGASGSEYEGIVDLLEPDYLNRPIDVTRLPLRYAVTLVHGRGTRVVYTFEDPNCGYCRELSQRLEEMGDITVHTFVLAFLGDDSKVKADAVWCSPDRALAWHLVMKKALVPTSGDDGCQAPTAETEKLSEMLGISLIPTLFFSNGSRMNGVKSRDEIERRLRAAGM